MECLALAGGFDSFPELKREQYFAVNSKGEVFLETLMRYGNRYQEDKELPSIHCSAERMSSISPPPKYLRE